jgi:O-antigen/teichoic acid export membrane protein|tara:strand:- start:1 stop:717 length:717 start_codon:yes stop_codon:yes gene_type:complete
MGIEWGKQGLHDYGRFARYFSSYLILYAILMSSILGVMILFYTVAVKIFLHEFLSSIPIFIILYFAINFFNIRSFTLTYLVVTRQIYKRLFILVLGVLSNIILCYLAVKLGYGVIGIAFAVAVSFIIVSINAIYVTFNQIFVNRLKKYVFLLKFLIISTVLTGLIYFYSDFTFFTFGLDYHNIGDMLLVLIDLSIKVSTFLLFTFVLYAGLFHKDNVYSELKNILGYAIQSVRVKFGY